MIRGMTLLWAALAVAIGCGLFLLKYQVQSLEDELAGLQRQIRTDREQIHVLEAEWAFLNAPSRLAELSQRLIGLEPLGAKDIVALAALPPRPPVTPGAVDGSTGHPMIGALPQTTPSGKPLPHHKPATAAELASVRQP